MGAIVFAGGGEVPAVVCMASVDWCQSEESGGCVGRCIALYYTPDLVVSVVTSPFLNLEIRQHPSLHQATGPFIFFSYSAVEIPYS